MRPGRVEGTEAERVQKTDGPRTHREDVADDAADAGRGTLIGLDKRRMVVRLDLEDRRESTANIDGTGILSRPLHDLRALRWAAS